MKWTNSIFAVMAPVLFLFGCSGSTPPNEMQETPFVVRNVRVFDGETVAENRTVLVQDGVIDQVGSDDLAMPAGTEIIDGSGRTLLPGLVDAHVHLSDNAESDLRQAAALGVTTVFDMFSASDRFDRIKEIGAEDHSGLAAVRSSGVGASAPGGHPSIMGGPSFPTISDAAEADAFVDARIGEGSDYLKIIYDDLSVAGMSVPMLDGPTLAALVEAAHAGGMRAVVHVMSEQHAREAIEVGSDGLAHLFIGSSVSADFAQLLSRSGAFVIPTLGVLHGICGQPNGESVLNDLLLGPYIRPDLRPMMSLGLAPTGAPPSCQGTDEAVRQLAREGVRILVGTDAPVPTQTYGASVHGEMALLVDVGLTPIQALRAATSAPAQAFGLSDRGLIRPGFRADLLLVDGDPTTDILATRRIDIVWKRGVRVERATYQE